MSTLSNLTADALNVFEPQRTNNILLHIVGLPAGVRNDGSATAVTSGANADAELVIGLENFPLPKQSQGSIVLGRLNEKRKFAGVPEFDDISVVYRDLANSAIYSILYAWRALVYNAANGKVGFAAGTNGGTAGYKRNGYAIEYAPDGTLARQWDIHGIWPSSLDPGDADLGGEDYVKLTCTLVIDKAVPAATPGTAPGDYQTSFA